MVLPVVSSVAVPAAPVSVAPAPVAADRAAVFEGAMSRHLEGAGAAEVAKAAPTETASADALERARAGFGLEPASPSAAPERGDLILDGMERLRGVFDASQNRVGEIMNRSGVDASSMMEMQLELTNFTLLVDMSSKLTGKTTQVFDTLMKGQ